MKIIIIGAGEVGHYLSEILSEANDVTVIEQAPELAEEIDEELDARVICGNGIYAGTLLQAGVKECDFFLAMTSDDRTNLISSSLAKVLGKRTTTITRIHDRTYNDLSGFDYQGHFGIDHLLNPEALSAAEFAKSIRNPSRVAVENLARGQVEVQQIRVHRKAKVTGKTLADLRIDRQIRIGYVQSGNRKEVAHADTVLEEGDLVTLFGEPQVLFEKRALFNPEVDANPVRVVLYGGGETSIALVRLLSHPRFKIRILEKNAEQCRMLAEMFPRVTVIHGDAKTLRLMEEEQIGAADYFVACTKDDEANIMTCLQASKLGTKHCLLLINRPDYIDVIEETKEALGVEMVVSPRLATANEVMRYTSRAPYVQMASLSNNGGSIIEIRVAPGSRADGKTFKEIDWPKHCIVVALLHDSKVIVPGADDVIRGHDRLVVLIENDQIPDVINVLGN